MNLFTVGCEPHLTSMNNDRIRLTNVYALFLCFVCIFVSSLLLYFKYEPLGYLGLFEASVFCMCLVANYFHKYDFSRFLLFFNGYLTIYIFSTGLGRNSATHFWFLAGSILPFILFDMRQRKYIFSCVFT